MLWLKTERGGLNNLEPHHTNIISQVQRRFLASFGVTSIRSFWNRSPSSHPVGMAWNFDHLQQMLTYGEGRPTSFHVLEPCGKHAKRFKVDKMFWLRSSLTWVESCRCNQSHLKLSVPSFCLRTSPLRSTTSDNLFQGGPRHSHLWPWNIDDQIIQSLSMHFKKLQNNLSWKAAGQPRWPHQWLPVTESKPFWTKQPALNYLFPLHSTPMLIYQLTMKTIKVVFHMLAP